MNSDAFLTPYRMMTESCFTNYHHRNCHRQQFNRYLPSIGGRFLADSMQRYL